MTSTKTHAHCKTPGCPESATFFPCERWPHLGFCGKHATQLLIGSVKAVLDGTHSELQKKGGAP